MMQIQTQYLSDVAMTTFKEAMQNVGIEPPAEIIADGAIHRFTVAGDRIGSKNGWYVLYDDTPAVGAFGCWKRGISEKWCSKAYEELAPADKDAYSAKMKAMKQHFDEERTRVQKECRTWCTEAWNNAKDATNDNPYLKHKNVNAYGLKLFDDSLLLPVQDTEGTIHGLQFIAPDGTKRFKTGTNKAGHFFKIGEIKDNVVAICEGYATGASIHQATGHAVVVAFDSGNLLLVVQNIRSMYPEIEIIIAADDDHTIKGNPGLTKATAAALAVDGLLAVPTFPNNRGPKDTDFNDLTQLAGLEVVRNCIEVATSPSPSPVVNNPTQTSSLDAAVKRLAVLSPLEYDQVRKTEAKEIGVRQTTLDAAVKNARRKSDTKDMHFAEVDPWPEAVDPASLLTDIASTIQRFIICSKEVSHAVALWIAMTWFIDVVQVVPIALITAPEPRCGKTHLLSLLGKLSARAITASNISPAALFRTIEAWQPTLLIDEADTFVKGNEDLRGLLDSGHTRDSAYVIRTVGENFTPTKFSTWGAKALAGIGHVANTIMDRSVILELRRKLSHEKVERIRDADPSLFDELRSKLARFAEDYQEKVRQARPPLPPNLNDRAQDNWEPLLAIAMMAGDNWLKIATTAAVKISGTENTSQTIGTELLYDIQEIFEEKQLTRISTAELIMALCADDEKPWATYNRGLPIKPRQLAKKLNGYGIHSKTIRIGFSETPKGFERHQFEDAFARYVSSSPENIRHTPQNLPAADLAVAAVADNPPRCGYETEYETLKTKPVAECGVVEAKRFPQAELFLTEDDILGVPI